MNGYYGGFENYNPDWPDISPFANNWIINGGWRCVVDYTDMTEPILNGDIIYLI